MRSTSSKQRSVLRWLVPGSILVGTSWFAGCSAKETPPGSDQPNDPLVCVAPQVNCAERCVDTAQNALNCGACGQACGSGQICQNSACIMGSCPAPTVMCAGACVDRQTDAQNCGACDAVCPAGASCQAGGCVGGGSGGSSGTGAGGASGTAGTGVGGTDVTGGTAGSAGSGVGGDITGGTGGSGPTGGSAGAPTGGSAGSAPTGGSGGSTTTAGCRVWVASNGNDSNPGTEASPVLTLLHAYDVACPKPPDGTENAECSGQAPHSICIKPSATPYMMTDRFEFKKTRAGTATNRVIVQGDPNATLAQRPVISFMNQARLTACNANIDNKSGFVLNSNYATLKNLIVERANDSCVIVQGAYGIVENVVTRNCDDTGIQIGSGGSEENPLSGQNNTVRNCDSYGNHDALCGGENADGFAIKEGSGEGNQFIGCRAWDNTDDGFDFFAWTDTVRLENSWAFDQSRSHNGANNDGNGFKLGGMDVPATHTLIGLFATGNTRGSNGEGFTRNSNPASMSCSGCAAWGNTDNSGDGISGLPGTAPSGATVAKMQADAARNADGSLKAIGSL